MNIYAPAYLETTLHTRTMIGYFTDASSTCTTASISYSKQVFASGEQYVSWHYLNFEYFMNLR